MAKTIKELSKEYGEHYPNFGYDIDGFENDDTETPALDFEAGANAVLGEIENIVIDNYEDTHNMAVRLIAKIKELKGK